MLPIRTINEIFRTIPSPRTKLASLVKSEVLSPDKIRATTGGIATPLSLAPHNILASLVKGRWIDGKAQTVALLHFYLRYIRLFYSPNFLPSRRRDCYTTLRSAPHLCPPLSKVRCCRPKKFGRLPEGLLYTTNPPKTALSHENRHHSCLPSKKGRWHGCRGFSACCTVFR